MSRALPKRTGAEYALWLIAALGACLAVEYGCFGLSQMDWSVPLLYGGDGVSGVNAIKEALRGGGLNGWPFYEPVSGYSANYSMLYTLFVRACGLFTDNFALVFNLYVLIIPPLNTFAAYCVFRAFSLRGALSAAGAVAFGLCPYVQQRLTGHMGLAACECVPLVVLLCFWCVEDENFNRPGKGFFRHKRNWLALLFAWLIANNGIIYYPFYGCFLLCVTALCLLLGQGRLKAVVPCLVTVAEIAFWVAAAFLPAVVGSLIGAPVSVTQGAVRGTVGGDIYGLRISSLLLSPNGYGIGKIADLINKYRATLAQDEGIMFNENAMGYLGILGVIGFLLLLAILFSGLRWQKAPVLGSRLWLLARLNLAAVLLGAISGFGALVTIGVRMIRCHTRISPYIIFVCLLAMVLCAEELLRRLHGKGPAVVAAGMAVLFVYAFWEQQGFFAPDYQGVKQTWTSDAAFVQEIEAQAGQGAMIYQLPYMMSFENGPVNKMADYTLYRGALHSDTLRWSYGAPVGSENDVWNQTTSELDPAAMVAELRAQGFAGIYLDRDGYEETDAQALEQALCRAAGTDAVLESEQGTLCYIPLT